MYNDEYEFDYDRVVEDSEELYDENSDPFFDDFYEDNHDYDLDNEREYDCYYHNVVDELDNEQPFLV